MAIERVIRRRSQGLRRNLQKAFHHDLAGERAGERGVLAGASSAQANSGAGEAHAEHGREQLVGVGDLGDVVQAARVEGRGAQDEDGGVDEEREAERDRGIDDGEADGLAAVANGESPKARVCTMLECR